MNKISEAWQHISKKSEIGTRNTHGTKYQGQ